jgi:heptosyltransferase-1
MRVLLVKLSSMGDLLHTLPAITDARKNVAGICFDWVVEEGFKDIPALHASVDRVLPVATRRWRRQPWSTRKERRIFRQRVSEVRYDLILDAQGLMKSAAIARLADGVVAGFDRASAREALATFCYGKRFNVDSGLHAIERQRRLFSLALGYEFEPSPVDYGIDRNRLPDRFGLPETPYIVLLHGTTWPSKRWPLAYWQAAGKLATEAWFRVVAPWSDEQEKRVATQITIGLADSIVLPRLELGQIGRLLSDAAGVIAVDTGLGHLAAALGVPCISIYGSTDPTLTGTLGANQAHSVADYKCAPCLSRKCLVLKRPRVDPPCYDSKPPAGVWSTLAAMITGRR